MSSLVKVPDNPVRVNARLDDPLSRWLWLAKWTLAVPQYVLLFFLWITFPVVSVIAFFAILFTERCPTPQSPRARNLGAGPVRLPRVRWLVSRAGPPRPAPWHGAGPPA